MARAERLPRFPLGASVEGTGILEDFPLPLGVLLASAIRDRGMRMEQGAPVPSGAAARLAAIRGHLGEQEVVAPLIVIARSVAGESPWELSEVTRASQRDRFEHRTHDTSRHLLGGARWWMGRTRPRFSWADSWHSDARVSRHGARHANELPQRHSDPPEGQLSPPS